MRMFLLLLENCEFMEDYKETNLIKDLWFAEYYLNSMAFQSKANTFGESMSGMESENQQSNDEFYAKRNSFFLVPRRKIKANSINDDFFEKVQRIRTEGGLALARTNFDSNDFSCFQNEWSDLPD